jgi:ADP-heptose:LPS heptosyltransferase
MGLPLADAGRVSQHPGGLDPFRPRGRRPLPVPTFADMPIADVRTDCRFYTGYKPCGKADACPGCTEFRARGAEILVIKLGAMGDVVRSKCLLPALKRAHPESWITWLTMPGSEPLVRDSRVDEIRTLSAAGVLALEDRTFDLLLCLDKDAAAVALAGRLNARVRRGFAPTPHNVVTVWNPGAEYALRMGLSDEFKYRINTLTHQQILHKLAELDDTGEPYTLDIPPDSQAAADARLVAIGMNPGGPGPLVGFNTGCGPVFETKQWTVEGFAVAASHLVRDSHARVVLLGGPREAELHRAILQQVAPNVADAMADAGTDNPLEVFFGMVNRMDAVVSADTLGMHVAIALRRPVVAFFGPTCEQEVDLYGRGEKIVTDYPCSPCYLKRCDVRPSCMQALDGRTVADAVRRVLSGSRG